MEPDLSGIIKILQGAADDALRQETIDGVSIAEVLELVDLDVAYSPVVEHAVDGDWPMPEQLSVTPLVKRDDGRYEARHQTDSGPTFEFLDAESVRVMRARYLLCRDHFAKSIEQYGYRDQQRILADFFPEGLWRPPDALRDSHR